MLRLKETVYNIYKIGDSVEFFNKKKIWVKDVIVGFKINYYVYKAIIKCDENSCCRFHYVCVCSNYLRKAKID